MKYLDRKITDKQFILFEALVIIGFAIVPLFVTFPYRVNIFLSWEGAYRLYLGQIPYRDFGLPMGFGYWLVPALFFKIFGPYLFSLVKAQVFINVIAGFTFRAILKQLDVLPSKRFLSVFVFCLSYSFFNFWPWYNHSVFIYQLVGIYFILRAVNNAKKILPYLYIFLAALFFFLSFFTKQDGGALAILFGLALLIYNGIVEKNAKYLLAYIVFLGFIATAFILPFIFHEFSYWFNYGQEPHYSRISSIDFVNEILGASRWEKFYLVVIVLILINNITDIKAYWNDKKSMLFTLLTVGILLQALIIQVTSYTPPDNNIYFHSFAFAFIISNSNLKFNFSKIYLSAVTVVLIMFWWSGVYYKYIQRVFVKYLPQPKAVDGKNIISKNTFVVVTDSTNIDEDMSEWKLSGLKAFDRVSMPTSTVEGINRLKNLAVFKGNTPPKILNMTELTPLAHELRYELERGQPLWYHLGVSMFDKEVAYFCDKVERRHYDLILFEVIPNLNNFYPYPVRSCIRENYDLVDTFHAPRRPTNATIEVYVKKVPSLAEQF